VDEAAWLLGFSPTDVPILVAGKILRPLGKPASNGVRYFSRVDLERKAAEAAWLDRACEYLRKHWRDRNERNRPQTREELTESAAAKVRPRRPAAGLAPLPSLAQSG
jgi:hypothetical protein